MKKSHKRFIGVAAVVVIVCVAGVLAACSRTQSGGSAEWEAMLATLPPDPGPAGNATLAGIDTDGGGQGVRDDVQRKIAMTYFDQPQQVKSLLMQYALATQQSLLDATASDTQKTIQDIQDGVAAEDCLVYLSNPTDASDMYRSVLDQITNTNARKVAFFKVIDDFGNPVIVGVPHQERSSKCPLIIQNAPEH